MPLFEGIGSYGGEKTAVILDIGGAYTKCGFAWESSPRAIIPTVVKCGGKKVPVLRDGGGHSLYTKLKDFVHGLYFRHLMVTPKEHRVVVVESILDDVKFRNTLARVLFTHFEVLSVCFVPSHLVALFTLGIPSGLVLDAGYSETVVLPVYEGVPILKAWEALPLGGRALHQYLGAQLMETCSVKVGSEDARPLAAVLMDGVEEDVVEDIKVRCCFVTKYTRSLDIIMSKLSGQPDKMPTPPPPVDYPLHGDKLVQISGGVREHTAEALFEMDGEARNVATLLLDAVIKCPVDMRRCMTENIILMGGTTMLAGFTHRLQMELSALVRTDKYAPWFPNAQLLFHHPPAQANYVAWLGGAIFGALEVLGSRSVVRETYLATGALPDWSHQLLTTADAPQHSRKSTGP